MKKNITFSDCKSYEDIKTKILAALEYDELVDDEEAARQWFKDAGMERHREHPSKHLERRAPGRRGVHRPHL